MPTVVITLILLRLLQIEKINHKDCLSLLNVLNYQIKLIKCVIIQLAQEIGTIRILIRDQVGKNHLCK